MKTQIRLAIEIAITAFLFLKITQPAFAQINKNATKVKMYGITFSAKEITGNKNGVLLPSTVCLAPPISSAKPVISQYSLIGQRYLLSDVDDNEPLLDMATDYNFPLPILDSINYTYYNSKGLFLLRESKYKNDAEFTRFDSLFKKSTDKMRRHMLYHSKFSIYRSSLEATRYDDFVDEKWNLVTGTANRRLQRSFAIDLADSITGGIKNMATFKQKLKAAIRDSIDKNTFSQFEYRVVSYDKDYLSIARYILSDSYMKKKSLEETDFFSRRIWPYFNSNNMGIVAGVSVIKANFKTTSFSKLETSIKAAIEAKLKNGSLASIGQAQAKISGRYLRAITTNKAIDAGTKYYVIGIAYNKNLEIGNGGATSLDQPCH